MSRADLTRVTGLSSPTITRIIQYLLGSGQVVAAGTDTSRPGRPGEVMQYNPAYGSLLGISFQDGVVTGVVADASGDVVGRVEHRPDDLGSSLTKDLALEYCSVTLGEAMALAADLGLPVRAVTIGVPGLVDSARGMALDAPNLDWNDVPLGPTFERHFDPNEVVFIVENDVSLGAYAHHWQGQAVALESFVVFSIGERVGSAIFSGGALLRGAHGAAGEIGFLISSIDKLYSRRAGGRGPLERFINAAGIVERWQQHPDFDPAALAKRELSVAGVLDAAETGDAAGMAVIDDTLDYVISSIVALSALIDPSRIIIDGTTGRALAPYIRSLNDGLRRNLRLYPDVVVSQITDGPTVSGPVRAGLLALLGPAVGALAPVEVDLSLG
ncbi:MAG: ROK family protein [Acidimicrobiales bacterium]